MPDTFAQQYVRPGRAPTHERKQGKSRNQSSTLPRLLSTNHGDDPTELCALRRLFPDDLVVDAVHPRQVRRALQHAVLQREHLLQRVVQERRAEADRVTRGARGAGQSHFELAGFLLFFRLLVEGLRLGLWSTEGSELVSFLPFGWIDAMHEMRAYKTTHVDTRGTGPRFVIMKRIRLAYLSTNVMLSAISATLLAIRPAMMAYADVAPFA